jgi:predicted transporter
MESYQVVGLIVSIIGVFLGIGMLFSGIEWIAVAGIGTVLFSFIGVFLPLLKTDKTKEVGTYYIVTGVLFNWLLVIAGIMAVRYKPQNATVNEILFSSWNWDYVRDILNNSRNPYFLHCVSSVGT